MIDYSNGPMTRGAHHIGLTVGNLKRRTSIVKEMAITSNRKLVIDDLSAPAKLESWNIEDLNDVLPLHEILAMDHYETL